MPKIHKVNEQQADERLDKKILDKKNRAVRAGRNHAFQGGELARIEVIKEKHGDFAQDYIEGYYRSYKPELQASRRENYLEKCKKYQERTKRTKEPKIKKKNLKKTKDSSTKSSSKPMVASVSAVATNPKTVSPVTDIKPSGFPDFYDEMQRIPVDFFNDFEKDLFDTSSREEPSFQDKIEPMALPWQDQMPTAPIDVKDESLMDPLVLDKLCMLDGAFVPFGSYDYSDPFDLSLDEKPSLILNQFELAKDNSKEPEREVLNTPSAKFSL